MPDPQDYAIGWISAIRTEYVAAQEFLDDEHGPPELLSSNDTNHYTLGRIEKHNVVIAVLPDGEYGTSSAASVATNMLRSFPNIRIGVLVGIGGGAPTPKQDIRLGDIVVSAPRDGHGGVFQYDFGKTIQDKAFQHTRFLNQPPTALRTALTGIKTQYERKGHQLEAAVTTVLEKNPRLRDKYKRPAPATDRLFKSEFTCDPRGCAAFCANEPSNLVARRERRTNEDNPAIHYGLIASANQLMKDATVRDKLATEKDVLCFEMEAAGLMNHFPCLVIRGICDYSDSHKNKEWQRYAAMTAAAYAKDLLCQITPSRVEAEKKIADILSGLPEVLKEQRDIAKEQLQTQKDLAEQRLSREEQDERQKCHQLFRLTTGSKDATYEWYKDRVAERVDGTCSWLLRHEKFQDWLKQESGPLLVTADPGCGKSVLAKYLIDHQISQSAPSTTICYFFFKDQDQSTVRQALCALLHQFFSQRPALIEHALPPFRKNGPGLIDSTKSLWEILRTAVQDPQAGPGQCQGDKFSHGKLKYLLTSRPYEQIVSEFRDLLESFPNIRIPGEQQSEKISQEVNLVITHRINQLSKKKGLSDKIKVHLEKRLQEITHRTYLWAYLVFQYLEEENWKRTQKGIDSTIKSLPGSVNQAYEQILSKSTERLKVQKALSVILVASRPLTLSEMNIALNIDESSQSIRDIDLESEKDFESSLRSLCGLFISIHHGRIYFLHQTAREFLLADPARAVSTPGLHWHRSISTSQAHAVLAKLCVLYLNLYNTDDSISRNATLEASDSDDNHSVGSHSVNGDALLNYSAKTWGCHFRDANIVDGNGTMDSALKIF
ncbi:hypothetical protein LMH87_001514 [Akanthomyces muscarius]|uniref:Nucleoside phosphorylase domain-containing protein n=1 Tax=Akanthomyces muscarius TaxID=2231603 RepID=A0A9W8UG70_AKAMU|nr:hypothetical protein LMH87_001514 [Akanthomyces muscarius]KAJ4146961.1 hypothetical protein LMH87_001514 [Akanthomyces muscarius]